MISKGGSGKTTTAIHLAAGLADLGKKVLVVDTDTQGHFAKFLKCDAVYGLAELGIAFLEKDDSLTFEDAVFSVRPNFDVLAGSGELARYDRKVQIQEYGIEEQLSEVLEGHDEKYDFVIVDTSPSTGGLHKNVYQYADEIIIPARLQYSTLVSLTDYFEDYNKFRRFKVVKKKQKLDVSYILPTFFDKRVNESAQTLEYLREFVEQNVPEAKILDSIPYDSKVSKAVAYGKNIYEFDSKSSAAKSYREFVNVILGKSKMEKTANG